MRLLTMLKRVIGAPASTVPIVDRCPRCGGTNIIVLSLVPGPPNNAKECGDCDFWGYVKPEQS